MPRINTPASGHVGPAPLPGGHQYLPYSDVTFLATLQRAIHLIDTIIRQYAPCNRTFQTLPGRWTFTQVWADPAIWINFDSSLRRNDFGETRGNEITITAFSLVMGHWTVATTLVHELAHVNGVPNNTHQAEATLQSCLLSGLEKPSIIGRFTSPSNARIV